VEACIEGSSWPMLKGKFFGGVADNPLFFGTLFLTRGSPRIRSFGVGGPELEDDFESDLTNLGSEGWFN
jgi:hypothetical protein